MAGQYFNDQTTSNHSSFEVQLYEFMRYGKTWFYAQADRDIAIGGPAKPAPVTKTLTVSSAGFMWQGGNAAFTQACGVWDAATGEKLAGWKHRSWHLGYFDQYGHYVFVDAYDNVNPASTAAPPGDPAGDAEANRLANDIRALGSGVTIILFSGDEPKSNLTAALRDTLVFCGATNKALDQIAYRGAYLLVGIPGSGEGGGVERVSGKEYTSPEGIPGDPRAYVTANVTVNSLPDPTVKYGTTYKGIQISDDGIKITGPGADSLKITMQADADLAALFIGTPPSGDVWVRIRRWQWGSGEQPIAAYIGTITQSNRPTPGTLELTCDNLGSSFTTNGLRLCWSRMCPHVLYDPNGCGANKNAYRMDGTLTYAAKGQLKLDEVGKMPDGWFDGGFVEWYIAPGVLERRGIEWHQGTTLSLLGFSDGFEIGQKVSVYAGCDRTITTCDRKFKNAPNYGGAPYLPGKSPYDGDPVF
ncbi:hypothetical protein WK13_34885 [Burkholderia ubonensis]|uniref:phage BR0599 family protein n=1 Tax=Burkholderia ubonensis TaxID=101571 RepID=UPI0007549002|nr:phage BR0599 family protein [Burkholderia ubonensis]KVR21727.1 hypothetical protein WK13_34885 [Burkholderia ubonensis]